MFNEMRRIDRKLDQSELPAILENVNYGILSTTGADGYPYGVPVNFVFVDGKLYFHGAKNVGSKIENIHRNPKVCFTVIGKSEPIPDKFSMQYESIIAFGEAAECSESCKRKILAAFLDKFSPDYKENGLKYIDAMLEKTAVYEITIHHLTGKARR